MIERFFSEFPEKMVASSFLLVLMDARAITFMAFCHLVFLDCFTRWLALSHEYLVSEGEVNNPSLLKCVKAIPAARRAGLIKSAVMREQGLDKLILYCFCAIGAGLCDLIFMMLHVPAWMTSFIVGYMAVTEILSIIENLSDAGVSSLSRLAQKLKGRL